MEKIWLKNYPAGVPAEINSNLYTSLVDLFQQSVAKYPDRPAVTGLGITLNYKELAKKSQQFASYLQQELKLVKGDRIALMMPNVVQYLIAMYGALMAGLVVVNVNPLYTDRELAYQLEDAKPKAILVLENFAKTVQAALTKVKVKHVMITRLTDMFALPKAVFANFMLKRVKKIIPNYELPQAVLFNKALTIGAKRQFQPVELTHQDLAFLQYTGGTTGVSKGAMLSHGNMVANVEQAFVWIGQHFHLGYERAGVILPLYHVFSLLANALIFLRAGSCCVLVANPRDLPALVEEFRKHKFTALMAVNTLINTLLSREAFRQLDLSDLRIVIAGGMALHEAVAERWRKITGVPVIEGYGLTEASPITCINPIDLAKYNGSIGLPVSSTEVKIIDEDNNELPVGQVGELCFKGPQIMQGYWNKPEESAQVLMPDGWLKTGDIARVDEQGFVYIVDRKKDMIDVAGFNVYPNEVEAVIAHHPKVREVAVVGVPNRVTGEMVKAYIVKQDPDLDKAELVAFCKENLVSYKIPKRIEFCDELPKNNVGKVLRRALREETA